MSYIYEPWEYQTSCFNELSSGLGNVDTLSLASRIRINKTKTSIYGKYDITEPSSDKINIGMKSRKEISISQEFKNKIKFYLLNSPNEISTRVFFNILNKPKHKVDCSTSLQMQSIDEDNSQTTGNVLINYHYSNNMMASLALNEINNKLLFPSFFTLSFMYGKILREKYQLNIGNQFQYNQIKKTTDKIKFLLDLKGDSFNSLLCLKFNKKDTVINEVPVQYYEKIMSFKLLKKINEFLTCGGETNFSIDTQKIDSILYSKHEIEPNTTLKTLWIDREKSITFGLTKVFRGILKAGINYKIFPKTSFFSSNKKENCFSSKLGFKLEIDDTLL